MKSIPKLCFNIDDDLVTKWKRWCGYRCVHKNLFSTTQYKHCHWFFILLDTVLHWIKGFYSKELRIVHETSHECVKSCLKGIFPMCGLLSGERQGKYSIFDAPGIGIRQRRSFWNIWHDDGEGGWQHLCGKSGRNWGIIRELCFNFCLWTLPGWCSYCTVMYYVIDSQIYLLSTKVSFGTRPVRHK